MEPRHKPPASSRGVTDLSLHLTAWRLSGAQIIVITVTTNLPVASCTILLERHTQSVGMRKFATSNVKAVRITLRIILHGTVRHFTVICDGTITTIGVLGLLFKIILRNWNSDSWSQIIIG